ncbi:hypothetical protein [Cereibacter johrii]|uniref:ZIP Zinc transporter n=1 Tax=Cereibacter johrii TaxID=445629 RepID=A0ABX5JEA6_9RHOB|nr:hypothetical protein [Cereibacter johrii]ODM41582.1 hypothetical protein A9O63_14070 [Cereibacter johrii]PTM80382.1 hypothetical protein C8J29_102460 [Cereibacter johrii]
MTLIAALLAAGLGLIHIFIGRLGFLGLLPRSIWLSAAGGVAVAYVFLHILPELGAHQVTFSRALGLGAQAAETWVFLVGLAGLTTFYGLERLAKASRKRSQAAGQQDAVEARLFWVHLGSFAVYNLLIGYLLVHREEPGLASLLLYAAAMAMHFVTSDFGLRDDHKHRYDRTGRWIMAAAVVAGWALGAVTRLPELMTGLLFAFLAGGIVLNVLKEELPEDRQSRFWPFFGGAAGYALVLVAI